MPLDPTTLPVLSQKLAIFRSSHGIPTEINEFEAYRLLLQVDNGGFLGRYLGRLRKERDYNITVTTFD